MKKFMTPRLIYTLMAVVALAVSSCKKSNSGGGGSNGQYYLKCKIDGTLKTFNGNTLAEMTDNNAGANEYNVSMVALKDANQMSGVSFSIVLASKSPFAANGVYTQDYLPNSFEAGASLVYTDEVGNLYSSFNETLTPGSRVMVTITALSAQSVKGTFSGTLYKSDLTFGHTITEGEFNIKR